MKLDDLSPQDRKAVKAALNGNQPRVRPKPSRAVTSGPGMVLVCPCGLEFSGSEGPMSRHTEEVGGCHRYELRLP